MAKVELYETVRKVPDEPASRTDLQPSPTSQPGSAFHTG
jgi:hypothetical protein